MLQEGQFERIGENKTRKVDVRIIAATNKDLLHEVKHKKFRQDLYFRLNVFPIESVPLRERLEDVPLLASHFLTLSLKKLNKANMHLTKANIERLKHYDWPGNIRELQNVIERGVILAHNNRLVFELPGHASADPTHNSQTQVPADQFVKTRTELQQEEINNILHALRQTNGKIFGGTIVNMSHNATPPCCKPGRPR